MPPWVYWASSTKCEGGDQASLGALPHRSELEGAQGTVPGPLGCGAAWHWLGVSEGNREQAAGPRARILTSWLLPDPRHAFHTPGCGHTDRSEQGRLVLCQLLLNELFIASVIP